MLLSPSEAAQRLGISYGTLKQWLYRGRLKSVRTPGGHYRIPEAELDSFLHQAKRPDTPKREMLRSPSGRNQLTGRIVELKIDGLLAQVKLSIGGQIITSIITSEAAREMRLQVGETASALIKSTKVVVLPCLAHLASWDNLRTCLKYLRILSSGGQPDSMQLPLFGQVIKLASN